MKAQVGSKRHGTRRKSVKPKRSNRPVKKQIPPSRPVVSGPTCPDDIYLIHVAQSEYREAFNHGDVERLLRVFHPEFVELSEGVPTFFGEDSPRSLRRRMTSLFETFQARMQQSVVSVEVVGATARSYGMRELTLTSRVDGKVGSARFRFIELWRRNDAGEWKMDVVIDNLEPPWAFPEVELPIPWFAAK